MAKTESTFMNMVLTLLVISFVASLALGSVYNLTKEPIEMARKAKKEQAIKEVIPAFDTLVSSRVATTDGQDSLEFNQGYLGGNLVGTAVSTYSNKGYDATQIQLMVGFLPDNTINNIAVIQQKETPGLGTKMKDEKFKDQFRGVDPASFRLTVKKDGGDVDAITAATISSRAFCDAVERAYKSYNEEKGDQP